MIRYLGSPRRGSWSSAVLLKVVWCSIAVAGQLGLSSSTSSASSLNFGTVQVGSSSTISTAVSNTGQSNLTITQATTSGSAFSYTGPNLPMTLAPGQRVRLPVTFAPQSAGSASGSLSLVTSTRMWNRNRQRYSTTTISLAGMGTAPVSGTPAPPGFLAASPSNMNFGSIQVASSQMLYETVTNSGGSSVTISSATVTGAGFSLSGFTASQTLAAGESLTLSVSFAPRSAGTASGTLTLASNASDANLKVSLSAIATSPGQLSVSPGSISFGNVVVGTSQSQTGTLSVSGSSVTVSSATSSSSEFVLSGLSFPLNIPAGQSVPFTIKFAPQISGTASASISFASINFLRHGNCNRHRCSGNTTQCRLVLESEPVYRCRIQRLPQYHARRALHEDQFQLGSRHALHRQHGSERSDLLLRQYCSECHGNGERLFKPTSDGDSFAIIGHVQCGRRWPLLLWRQKVAAQKSGRRLQLQGRCPFLK